MKKTSVIVKGIDTFEISVLINNIALVYSMEGTSGLLDIRDNKLMGKMRSYYTQYDTHRKFYTQTWSDDNSNNNNNNGDSKKTYIRVCDAKDGKILVDDCELLKIFRNNYEAFSVRTLKDNKVHLYDIYSSRSKNSVFNYALDDAEKLLDRYNDSFYVLTKNSKKALYFSNCYDKSPRMITDFSYDNIEYAENVLIFTSNGKKHFRFFDSIDNKSIEFDEIKIDENNKNILYGIKGNTIYVYNTVSKELMLQTDADSIEYIGKDGDSYNEFYGEYFFKIVKNGKCGLSSSRIDKSSDNKRVVEQTVLLDTLYDDIDRGKYSKAFYLEKNGLKGLLVGNGNKHQVIEPAYDDITNLSDNHYSFLKNGLLTIKKVSYYDSPKTIISECQNVESVGCGYLLTKDDKKGLLVINSRNGNTLIDPDYDDIKEEAGFYYITHKRGKYGVICRAKTIIPNRYDEIKLGGECQNSKGLKDSKVLYFALKSGNSYELAKIDNYEYCDCDVQFVNNHRFSSIDFYNQIMVLRDENYTYIYSYDEKLLKTLPSNATISEIDVSMSSYDKKYFYELDGKIYYYRDGKLSEQYSEVKDMFVTRYESDTDVYEVKSLNRDEYNSFCQMIDEMSDEDAESTLQDFASNKQKVKSKYPRVNLNRIPKNEE